MIAVSSSLLLPAGLAAPCEAGAPLHGQTVYYGCNAVVGVSGSDTVATDHASTHAECSTLNGCITVECAWSATPGAEGAACTEHFFALLGDVDCLTATPAYGQSVYAQCLDPLRVFPSSSATVGTGGVSVNAVCSLAFNGCLAAGCAPATSMDSANHASITCFAHNYDPATGSTDVPLVLACALSAPSGGVPGASCATVPAL